MCHGKLMLKQSERCSFPCYNHNIITIYLYILFSTDVLVYNVDIFGVKPVQPETENDITVDVEISAHVDGGNANGTGLWKLSMWASEDANGRGRRIGFKEQV